VTAVSRVERLPATHATSTEPLLAYFGHHKCGSTWLGDIFRDLAAAAGLEVASVHNAAGFGSDLKRFVSDHHLDVLVYVNANRRFVDALDAFRGVHMIRDPRDIVTSSYFSHLHSHPTEDWPELVEHRTRLRQVDEDRGLYLVMDFVAGVMDDIATWDYGHPGVIELKMEDVVRDPERSLVPTFTQLGVVNPTLLGRPADVLGLLSRMRRRWPGLVRIGPRRLPPSAARDLIKRHSFATKAGGRQRGVEDAGSHYRKGVSGDWVNHFNEGHKRYFKSRYPDLLERLGYEHDDCW
jgi:hypothetical protein